MREKVGEILSALNEGNVGWTPGELLNACDIKKKDLPYSARDYELCKNFNVCLYRVSGMGESFTIRSFCSNVQVIQDILRLVDHRSRVEKLESYFTPHDINKMVYQVPIPIANVPLTGVHGGIFTPCSIK